MSVIHRDYDLTRQDKVKKVIKPYINKYSSHPLIIVYNSYSRKRELHNCAKCAQAILALFIEEIDPRKCGFPITEKHLNG